MCIRLQILFFPATLKRDQIYAACHNQRTQLYLGIYTPVVPARITPDLLVLIQDHIIFTWRAAIKIHNQMPGNTFGPGNEFYIILGINLNQNYEIFQQHY